MKLIQAAKDMLKGIGLAVAVAYVFAIFLLFLEDGTLSFWEFFLREGWAALTVLPGLMLLVGSWVFVPMGAALGILIPKIVAGRSRKRAALLGAGMGFLTGLLGGTAIVLVYSFVREAAYRFVLLMAPYCALWVGVYAYRRAGRQT